MCFVVVATHPIVEGWEDVEASLRRLAGRQWDHGEGDGQVRELRWFVNAIGEAVLLRQALAQVGGVSVISRDPVDKR